MNPDFTSRIRPFARHSRAQPYYLILQALDNAANGRMRLARRVNIFQRFWKSGD
jgi:hypothetical protein